MKSGRLLHSLGATTAKAPLDLNQEQGTERRSRSDHWSSRLDDASLLYMHNFKINSVYTWKPMKGGKNWEDVWLMTSFCEQPGCSILYHLQWSYRALCNTEEGAAKLKREKIKYALHAFCSQCWFGSCSISRLERHDEVQMLVSVVQVGQVRGYGMFRKSWRVFLI